MRNNTQRIKVSFTHIKVHDDADNWLSGEGEIYYQFKAGDHTLAERTSDNSIGADSGDTINIFEDLSTTRTKGNKKPLIISGSVSEEDSGLTFEDDHAGSFTHIYRESDHWGMGSHAARLKGDGLDVTVHYVISGESELRDF